MKPKNVGAALIPFEPKMRVDTVLDDGAYQEFLAHNGKGLQFALQDRGSGKPGTLPDRYGDFAKWLRQHHPSVPVALPPSIGPIHALRDSHVWLPVVMLAADTSVQLFLNMAASYLYDQAKGLLKNEKARINLSVIYQDEPAGITKKFEFSGDGEALSKVIKRFDLNKFLDESS